MLPLPDALPDNGGVIIVDLFGVTLSLLPDALLDFALLGVSVINILREETEVSLANKKI